MKRRLFNLLAGVSLVLLIAVVTLWVRSYWVEDAIKHGEHNSMFWQGRWQGAASDSGRLMIEVHFVDNNATALGGLVRGHRMPVIVGWQYDRSAPAGITNDENSALRNWGFYLYWRAPITPAETMTLVGAPHWAAVVVFSLLPVIWLLRLFRRQLLSLAGLCASCGYDLRATPERCPECGAVAARTEAGK